MKTLKLLERACPICSERHGEKLHSQRFALPDNHPLKEGYDVVLCSSCGFAFADTKATQEEYDAYYASLSKYGDKKTSTGGGALFWDADRLKDTALFISSLEKDRDACILDMGCANGGLLKELKNMGYTRLAGIDPSPDCVANTRSIGVEAWTATFFNMPSPGQFNGIILSHVMEHVRDLRPALERIHEMLVPGGWVYVEVPDAMHYKDYLVAPFQDFNTEHINHFSLTSLANLMKVSGFREKEAGSKTILSAPHMPYPAIWRTGAKIDLLADPEKPRRDNTLQPALKEYIAASSSLLARLETRLSGILKSHPQLIVWGTGQLTLKLLSETCLGRACITAFVDTNPVHHGKLLKGIPILAPEELAGRREAILAASLINEDSIVESIKNLGIPNPIVTLGEGVL